MRSIQAKYRQLKGKNPSWSSAVWFLEAVRNQNFSEDVIRRWFNRLVDKDDYSKKQKKDILQNAYRATKEMFKPKEKLFIPRYYSK